MVPEPISGMSGNKRGLQLLALERLRFAQPATPALSRGGDGQLTPRHTRVDSMGISQHRRSVAFGVPKGTGHTEEGD